VGEGGSGHFVKMVHNGIEYGDMQLIAETYLLLKHHVGLNNEEISQVFDQWNRGDLESYLIEITRDIFRKKDESSGKYVIDLILDAAGQKGTGKWTVESGLDFGAPITLIAEAVFGRILSSHKSQRVAANTQLRGPESSFLSGKNSFDRNQFILDLHDALYASKIVSYAQGFLLLRAAASHNQWNLNYGGIALMWRGGCIIRSKFLAKIKDAFQRNPELHNLLFDHFFTDVIHQSQAGWRRVCASAALNGYAIPAIYSALSYYDGLRTASSTSNLIQAQRDFFGAHTYERIDKPRGTFFHTNWSGQGGSTASSVYNA
jgi:6-phosphogluconate dehydrogenase